jgi:hypothetical protein
LADKSNNTNSEIQKAIELLGREPRTPFEIITRCADGSAQVLLADPVFREEGIWKPFPTFLWLVCPVLKLKAAHLEQDGFIKKFSERLCNEEDFRNEFIDGQNEIRNIRIKIAKKILKNEQKIPEHILTILSKTTVAGSFNLAGVKCLHSHIAQELAYHNNPIGREALELVGNCDGNHERSKE